MNWRGIGAALSMIVLLTACAASSAAEPDRVATRVAEDLAVARTLTAVAQVGITPAPDIATSEPSDTPAALDTPAPLPTATTAPLATDAPTAAPPTAAPPTVPPPPTNTPLPEDPTVPGFGDPHGLIGQIVLPGYSGPVNPPVFTDRIVFRLKVYDPDKGRQDGAGIISVDMSIVDPSGKTVQSRTERTAGYCVFGGGEPNCVIWNFHEHNNAWPDGTPVCTGDNYQANMNVHAADANKDGAFWGFNFSISGDYPPCS